MEKPHSGKTKSHSPTKTPCNQPAIAILPHTQTQPRRSTHATSIATKSAPYTRLITTSALALQSQHHSIYIYIVSHGLWLLRWHIKVYKVSMPPPASMSALWPQGTTKSTTLSNMYCRRRFGVYAAKERPHVHFTRQNSQFNCNTCHHGYRGCHSESKGG